jgi:CRP-like cAMP-binding protein
MAINQELLERIEAFKGFTEDQLAKVKNLCVEVSFRKNGKIVTAGDPATHVLMVTSGRVGLRFAMNGKPAATAEQTVSMVMVTSQKSMAETIGWSCVVPLYRMRLSAYCVFPICRIIRMPKDQLLKIFEVDPSMG